MFATNASLNQCGVISGGFDGIFTISQGFKIIPPPPAPVTNTTANETQTQQIPTPTQTQQTPTQTVIMIETKTEDAPRPTFDRNDNPFPNTDIVQDSNSGIDSAGIESVAVKLAEFGALLLFFNYAI